GLVLRAGAAPGAAPDTTASASGWRVRWRGFRVGTDLPAFSALRSGQPPPGFVLLDGTGMTVDSDARVIGAPRVARRRGAVTFAARDSLAGWSVDLLATGTTRRDSVRAIASVAPADVEIASGWARQRLPRMMAALGVRDSLPDLLQTSYAYLNGWDGAYRADGIAPSIFEWWLRSHRDLTGGLPDLSDSLDVALLPSSLRIARAELRDRYGTVPSDWRWGNVQGGPAYPVLASRRSPAARPFQMALAPPGGHPTAARPGPSIVFEGAQPGRAVWTIRIDTRTGVTSVRSPSMRTDVDDGLDLQADPGGPRLILDPRAPVPADLLTLTPAS
ncbi:MAG: penicillin acylase family protein, partial [Bacteroidota bacterium]